MSKQDSSSALNARLQRLIELASETRFNGTGLLAAFAACLSLDEACCALVTLIEAQQTVRRAVLNRVLYLSREDADPDRLSRLADELLIARAKATRRLPRFDAILSNLLKYLPNTAKHSVLEVWKSDGRRASKLRWLKSMAEDLDLFEPYNVLQYWRDTHDWQAAKLLAYSAPVQILNGCLGDLVDNCDEGWIIAKASLRVTDIPTDTRKRIREKFPATYAYLCAKKNYPLTHKDAIDLYFCTSHTELSGGRGLAAWSIGYMGMWDTLEEIRYKCAALPRPSYRQPAAPAGIAAGARRPSGRADLGPRARRMS